MSGNPELRAQLGVCFVGAHAVALGVCVAGFLTGSSLFLMALLAYGSLPWWLLFAFVAPGAFDEDRIGISLLASAVLNLVLHAAAWWWAWRRAWRRTR